MTAVAGLELDVDTRNEMLMSAADEALRASAELAAIGALSAPRDAVDLGPLDVALDLVRLAGVDVTHHGDCGAVPTDVTAALIRVVSGASGAVRVDASPQRIVIARVGGDTEPLPAIAADLAAVISDTGVACEVVSE